jgi:hypothetical protein
MAIAIDVANIGTDVNNGASQTTVALTTTSAVASNGFIVLGIGWFGSTFLVSGVSGGGLSWSVDKQGVTSSIGTALVSAQAPSGLASSTTITVTFTGSVDVPTIGGTSFTGVATSSPVDGTPLGPTEVTTAAWSSGSYTIAAGSVIVATNWTEGVVTGNTPTAPSVEAWDVVTSDSDATVLEYNIQASDGSYTVEGTWNAAHKNQNVAVAYLAASGGGGVSTILFPHRMS